MVIHGDPQQDPRRGKTAADEDFLRRVGDRVRATRDQLGITRKKLSEKSGVSERYLADLEVGSGNASLIILRRIAQVLHLDMEQLLAAQPDPSPELKAILTLLADLTPDQLTAARHRLQRGLVTTRSVKSGRIALIGLRGAGKTTVGRAVADSLALPFIELDREIERAAGMELSEIFALQGKVGFRQHELRCLTATIDQHQRAIIATGGSLVTEPAAFDLLLSNCFVVWLKADPESHMNRVMAQGDLRPMADNPQAMDDLRAIVESRRALYSQAHATIDTSTMTIDQAIAAVRQKLAPVEQDNA